MKVDSSGGSYGFLSGTSSNGISAASVSGRIQAVKESRVFLRSSQVPSLTYHPFLWKRNIFSRTQITRRAAGFMFVHVSFSASSLKGERRVGCVHTPTKAAHMSIFLSPPFHHPAVEKTRTVRMQDTRPNHAGTGCIHPTKLENGIVLFVLDSWLNCSYVPVRRDFHRPSLCVSVEMSHKVL